MLFDLNAWIGSWPFRSMWDNTAPAMLERMDRHGINWAAVSSLEAIFHRNGQPANEKLAEDVAPYSRRLFPLATINPSYVKWEDDLKYCHEKLNMKGVRLVPQYQGWELKSAMAVKAVQACTERGLLICIPHRLEDPRQAHPIDPGRTVEYDDVVYLLRAVPAAKIVLQNIRVTPAINALLQPDLIDKEWYVDLALTEVHFNQATLSFLDKVGGKHLVFGTHSPHSYAGSALVKLELLPVAGDEKADVCYRHAARLLNVNLMETE
ncbi:MAG TPA: amidohydrolase family protein [Firmicutes bacterium]|nr:amidohydrolase family protein [Bacillota bacterium]